VRPIAWAAADGGPRAAAVADLARRPDLPPAADPPLNSRPFLFPDSDAPASGRRGADMTLARDLLARGERDAVLAYLGARVRLARLALAVTVGLPVGPTARWASPPAAAAAAALAVVPAAGPAAAAPDDRGAARELFARRTPDGSSSGDLSDEFATASTLIALQAWDGRLRTLVPSAGPLLPANGAGAGKP
jgi:hypothetical protein